MFAYCNNNPVMFTDTKGEGGVLAVLACCFLIGLLLSVTSCEKQEPTI